MRGAITLLFLIISYNFLLWYITKFGFSPIPLFPEDPHNTVLVLAYNSVLYISWLFGERHRAVQWIGYLYFFQVVALSAYFGDLEIIVRNLPPVILTFAMIALFESPTEKEIKEIHREREKLLKEIDKVVKERERVEVNLRLLKQEIEKLEKEKHSTDLTEEQVKTLEQRIEKLQKELRDFKEKEAKLLEANRKLFQLLEHIKEGAPTESGKGELSSLRKERKKLIRELIQLQEIVDTYVEENEHLKRENDKLKKELEELKRELSSLSIELESLKASSGKVIDTVREVLSSAFGIELSDRSVEELLNLPPDKQKVFLKELMRLANREGKENLQPLATLPNIYKLRFSGGRIYLKRSNGSWQVVGILGSEDDKEKDRYIKNVLSKIDTVK